MWIKIPSFDLNWHKILDKIPNVGAIAFLVLTPEMSCNAFLSHKIT